MDELLERKNPTSAEILSKVPVKDQEHGSGNPHLQPGELHQAWRGEKPAKPKK